jgi:hypothetical protein
MLGLLTCCGQSSKNIGSKDSVNTAIAHHETQVPNGETTDSENDCIFNNDYKGLTTKWLNELEITDFIWRADLEQALIPKGQDTVFLSKGGCHHFGISVEMKFATDNHALADSTFWINSALEIANEYKLEHYAQMIKEGRIRKVEERYTNAWYGIEDNDDEDNLFYTGIEINIKGQYRKIRLTQYYN